MHELGGELATLATALCFAAGSVLPANRLRGLLYGLGAATGQALGLVLARQGLVGDFSPLSGNFIRLSSAILAICCRDSGGDGRGCTSLSSLKYNKPMTPTLADQDGDLYQKLYLIRRFEETILEYFPKGVFFGTTHTYLGQEANAVGVLRHIEPEDVVFSNHRCHGHFLAYGGDPGALFAELMGKSSGVCGGRGGSQHLQWRNFYSNGVQGGIVPIATGMGLAARLLNSPGIAIAFLGDGTLGQGVVYEALNLASLWQIPILYVVENNRIAQTTPSYLAIAGDMAARFQAFDISTTQLDSSDVMAISQTAAPILEQVRAEKKPAALILHTCRFGPHSKGDDTRPAEEVNQMRRVRDPIQIHGKRLREEEKHEIETAIDAIIQQAFQRALRDPYPAPTYGT